jgi:quinol monooxygenase YgiN
MLKGYHAAFDNIKYTANNWLPGTSPEGKLDGSVRTYGTWTGVNVATGKELNLKGYWYMNFDEEGKIIAQGDFFDFGGMIDAVYPKSLVIVQIEVQKEKKQEVLDILNSEGGLPTTRAYDGCISLEMVFNEDSNTFHIIGNWESFEKYQAYLNWRQTKDTVIGKMVPYLEGGEKGLKISQPNTGYQSY